MDVWYGVLWHGVVWYGMVWYDRTVGIYLNALSVLALKCFFFFLISLFFCFLFVDRLSCCFMEIICNTTLLMC